MVQEEPPEEMQILGCGWHVTISGSPVQVATKAWSMRLPEPKHKGDDWPLRITWIERKGQWSKEEDKIEWAKLSNAQARLKGRADRIITLFERHGKKWLRRFFR